jgi:hypothetical protein
LLPVAMPNPVLFTNELPLHFTSAKGNKNKSIPTANATPEGILVPKMPGAGGGDAGDRPDHHRRDRPAR